MSTRNSRVEALQHLVAGSTHLVALRLRPDADSVTLVVTRDSRRDAKGDSRLQLSLTAARTLQRALQGAVDEGYRLQAEREQRRSLPRDLAAAVDRVAHELEVEP
ncbi:MAG: hypothetical protein DI536_28985 [Archangium gephyra]|uniref:Uncharacterized protein n=1 Tax=Archangium gephyra TaxID=48 RepID=A0A2W5UUS7_9BACT|nr:MAG: hypothetical protein DI536_28985 [Archangium gephyra]